MWAVVEFLTYLHLCTCVMIAFWLQARSEVLAQLEAVEAASEPGAQPPPGFYYVSASWLM